MVNTTKEKAKGLYPKLFKFEAYMGVIALINKTNLSLLKAQQMTCQAFDWKGLLNIKMGSQKSHAMFYNN